MSRRVVSFRFDLAYLKNALPIRNSSIQRTLLAIVSTHHRLHLRLSITNLGSVAIQIRTLCDVVVCARCVRAQLNVANQNVSNKLCRKMRRQL